MLVRSYEKITMTELVFSISRFIIIIFHFVFFSVAGSWLEVTIRMTELVFLFFFVSYFFPFFFFVAGK